jgi:hypothetical protein
MSQAAATRPEIRRDGDPRIAAELEQVRRHESLLGVLPAFRRGRMFYDYNIDGGMVRIAPGKGGAP